MTEPKARWDDLVGFSAQQNLLAKRLYVVVSEPTNGLGPIGEAGAAHLAYQAQLEKEGVMFAARPLGDSAEQEWAGDGMFIYRAASQAKAVKIAEADPMHATGARRFTVRPWLLNEGTLGIRVFYSGNRPEIT